MPNDDTNNDLTLVIQGLGHVPSFKNTKMICGLKRIKPKLWTGTPFLITQPKKKEWMEAAINQLVSQLRGMYPTAEGAMLGECPKPLPIALSRLLDDSLGYMIPGAQSVKRVSKGNEGATITIQTTS